MKALELRETTVYYCDICGEEASSGLTEYYGCHHHACSRHDGGFGCPVCAKGKEAKVSNAQDERDETMREAKALASQKADADRALNRLTNAIDNLHREVSTLQACLGQRWTSGPEHIRSYCDSLLARSVDELRDARLTLGAAQGFYAADPARTVAICQNIQAATEWQATGCQIAIGFLEQYGYITFGHLRAVGGHRGD
jgi:uncharacterized Zn finger protein (UPF0148 family)